jgi:hypothetical protein
MSLKIKAFEIELTPHTFYLALPLIGEAYWSGVTGWACNKWKG